MDELNLTLPSNWAWGLGIVSLFGLLSFLAKKIDFCGAIGGVIIAFAIFLGGGFSQLFLLFVFFALGSLASSWKIKQKEVFGVAEKNRGKRTIVNALSNGGVAAMCGLVAFLFPQTHLIFNVMLAASLASATSDTLSSELGNVYGRRYVYITNFKQGKRGADGVISLKGTAVGLIGSILIGLTYVLGQGFSQLFWVIIAAGFLGNLFDSLLGATLQQQGLMNNHMVNVCNTLFAALSAGIAVHMLW